MNKSEETIGMPWVKKVFSFALNTGPVRWEIQQQVRQPDGKITTKILKTFDDPHEGERQATNWMRSHTNLYPDRR